MVHGTTFHVRGTLLPDGDRPVDLWVVDGRITFEPQDGAEDLVPGDGFILPGLVDAHVHMTSAERHRHDLPVGSVELTEANRRLAVQRGILVLRDMGPVLRRGETQVATLGGIAGDDGFARVHAAGEMLTTGGFSKAERVVQPADLTEVGLSQVQEAHAAHRHGAPWVKVILENFVPLTSDGSARAFQQNYSVEAMSNLVTAVHEAGGRVAVHTMNPAGAATCIEAGVDSIEHGWGLDEDLLARAARAGIAWTPTLRILQGAREQAVRKDEDHQRWANEAHEHVRSLIARARALGVTVLAGTDSGMPLFWEISALQEAGLTPSEALAAASTTTRRFLGEPDVDEGAPADLVYYEHDPREDPEELRKPRVLMVSGRRVEG